MAAQGPESHAQWATTSISYMLSIKPLVSSRPTAVFCASRCLVTSAWMELPRLCSQRMNGNESTSVLIRLMYQGAPKTRKPSCSSYMCKEITGALSNTMLVSSSLAPCTTRKRARSVQLWKRDRDTQQEIAKKYQEN